MTLDFASFRIQKDAELGGAGGDVTDETCDALFFRFVQSFGDGKKSGDFFGAKDIVFRHEAEDGVRAEDFARVSAVASGGERADALLAMREAEEMGVHNHVAAVTRVAVVIDEHADVVENAGRQEKLAVARRKTVETAPAVEKGERHRCHIGDVGFVVGRQGVVIIFRGSAEHIFDGQRAVLFLVIIEEKTFANAAAGDGQSLGRGHLRDGGNDERARDDDVRALGREAGDAFSFGERLFAKFVGHRVEIGGRQAIIVELG